MHHAQILGYGIEGRLAEVLQEWAQGRGVWLREVSHAKTCLNLLRKGGGGVLVLRVANDLEKELSLLETVGRLFPATRALVVLSSDDPHLAAMAWDLGASFVLAPPLPVEKIGDLLAGLLAKGPSAGEEA